MHGRTLATAMMAIALLSGASGAASADAAVSRPALERAVMREMNAVRAAHGRPALRRAAPLARPARGHSSWLVRTGEFRHEGPDGAPFWTRLIAAGFPRSAPMGENLALASGCGTDVAAQAVSMWLKSPGHRANLLSPRFRLAGVGVVSTADCTASLVTADYGGRG